MAVTIDQFALAHFLRTLITFTADGDADIKLPDKPVVQITLQSDGVDGGGTLTVLGSNDGSNFVAISFNTSADPHNLTMIASATASGAWVLPPSASGFGWLRFHLTGSTTPTLVLNVGQRF